MVYVLIREGSSAPSVCQEEVQLLPHTNPELIGVPSDEAVEWLSGASGEEPSSEWLVPPASGGDLIHYAEDEDFYEQARGESDVESDDNA